MLDCGLLHTCDADERPRYVVSVASVTARDGMLYILCFSDQDPEVGPHPVSERELRAAFTADSGWTIVRIESDRVHTRFHGEHGAPAWLATIRRT